MTFHNIKVYFRCHYRYCNSKRSTFSFQLARTRLYSSLEIFASLTSSSLELVSFELIIIRRRLVERNYFVTKRRKTNKGPFRMSTSHARNFDRNESNVSVHFDRCKE